MKMLDLEVSDEDWFRDRLAVTRLADLAKTGHQHLDPCLISAFAERWNDETSSFHMSAGEITVTLEDVS
ncbi:serine/threonine-protein phosphatase 7 long form-like protein [Trifolium medium]|uniref:Serine/threonine-protein phosphatase 7 long form-like protein n=1 Tax=Trifolium medium TaxID=97028 RepID=A0A392QZS0_9FABA|nr:serine/threonine-protein phosphatase 7 long form-like protein [Trifolium medium]